MSNFAIVGAAGFIAPRHLDAIRDSGHQLVAAMDPFDSVGLLDRYSFDVRFFREIGAFDKFLAERGRGPDSDRVSYVSICSPNYLHEAHLRLALRAGAHAICEKPLVLAPSDLDALEDLERETARRIFTVLQLRVHPSVLALKDRLERTPSERRADVELTYVTSRGPWYDLSWKGSEEKSGGVVLNIGIHLFDLLLWLFGPVSRSEVHLREARTAAGFLEMQRAEVRWLLSIDRRNLPADALAAGASTHRSITIDGEEIEIDFGFSSLHTRVYEATLADAGFGVAAARPSIELAHAIRTARIAATPSSARHFVASSAPRS